MERQMNTNMSLYLLPFTPCPVAALTAITSPLPTITISLLITLLYSLFLNHLELSREVASMLITVAVVVVASMEVLDPLLLLLLLLLAPLVCLGWLALVLYLCTVVNPSRALSCRV